MESLDETHCLETHPLHVTVVDDSIEATIIESVDVPRGCDLHRFGRRGELRDDWIPFLWKKTASNHETKVEPLELDEQKMLP